MGILPPRTWNLLGCFKILDYFLEFFFGFLHPGHVRERGLGFILHVHPGLALADAHDATGAGAHAAEDEQPQAHQQQHGQNPGNQRGKPGAVGQGLVLDALFLQQINQVLVFHPHRGKHHLLGEFLGQTLGQVGVLGLLGQILHPRGEQHPVDGVTGDFQIIHALHVYQVAKVAVIHGIGALHGKKGLDQHQHQEERQENTIWKNAWAWRP